MAARLRRRDTVRSVKSLAILLGCVLPAASVAEPPNIVLIMADDLGCAHLGSYGQTRIKTPNIDRMAADVMRFTQAYAGSAVCAPSRSVLLTGLHGGHTPVRGNLGDTHLRDSDITVAEVLKTAGYWTGAYGKWGLGRADSPGHPLRQGFDDFLGYLHQVHAHFFYPFWLTFNYGRMNLRLNETGGAVLARCDRRARPWIHPRESRRAICRSPYLTWNWRSPPTRSRST